MNEFLNEYLILIIRHFTPRLWYFSIFLYSPTRFARKMPTTNIAVSLIRQATLEGCRKQQWGSHGIWEAVVCRPAVSNGFTKNLSVSVSPPLIHSRSRVVCWRFMQQTIPLCRRHPLRGHSIGGTRKKNETLSGYGGLSQISLLDFVIFYLF